MLELWSKLSRWDKALALLLGVYLALWPLEPLSGAVRRLRLFLQFAVYAAGSVVIVRTAIAAAKLLLRRFLWRVRHRMIAVFFFVGVIPLSLSFLLFAYGFVLVFGPIAAYMVTASIEKQAAALHATADSLSWQLRASTQAERERIGQGYLDVVRRRYPGMLIRYETPEGPVTFPEDFRMEQPPRALENYRGLVRMRRSLYLAAYAEYEPGAPSLLVMLPLDKRFLRELLPGLGVVESLDEVLGAAAPASFDASAKATRERPGSAKSILRSRRRIREIEKDPARERLPEPAHPFDWPVSWPAQTSVLDWEAGTIRQEPALLLRTRPSAVVRLVTSMQSPLVLSMARTFGYMLAALFAAAGLVSLVVAVSITRTVTGAVHDLSVGTQHVHEGDFSYRAPVRGEHQLTELARSFNVMTASIERLIEDSKERERLEAELEIAREVQAQLFPGAAPAMKSLEALGVCRPARMISGDFYDYVKISPSRLSLVFGDVAGKGISAALVMAAVHSIVRTQLALAAGSAELDDLSRAAARLVAETNRQLCAGTAPEKFSTLFFGIYDETDSALVYANAGHLPPLLIRGGEARPLEVTGMVVGAFPDADYESSIVELKAGDLLVAFTDGVTEPENLFEEQFGEQRLTETLIREADRPLEEIIRVVMQEVDDWTGRPELQDDMTMLAARRL